MKQKVFNVIVVILITLVLVVNLKSYHIEKNYDEKLKELILLEQPEFLISDSAENNLYEALIYYDIEFPDIVYAQAVLETGYFRSKVCKEYNNLFGLYNSRTRDYFKFNHWSESVVAYKMFIQRRYSPKSDYYDFLRRIGYAEDPNYINKVKSIEKKENDKRYNTKENC